MIVDNKTNQKFQSVVNAMSIKTWKWLSFWEQSNVRGGYTISRKERRDFFFFVFCIFLQIHTTMWRFCGRIFMLPFTWTSQTKTFSMNSTYKFVFDTGVNSYVNSAMSIVLQYIFLKKALEKHWELVETKTFPAFFEFQILLLFLFFPVCSDQFSLIIVTSLLGGQRLMLMFCMKPKSHMTISLKKKVMCVRYAPAKILPCVVARVGWSMGRRSLDE